MGLFSFSSHKPQQPPQSTQIEQRSHTPLNVPSVNDGDIAQTLDQLNQKDSVRLQTTPAQGNELKSTVTDFVNATPDNVFIIDGEKDIKESIICTSNPNGGKTCLKLQIHLIELFKIMQGLEYFCLLPDDVDATYFECRKIK